MYSKDYFVVKATDKADFDKFLSDYKVQMEDLYMNNKEITVQEFMDLERSFGKNLTEIFNKYSYLSNVQNTDEVNGNYEYMIGEYQKYSNPLSQNRDYYEFIKSLTPEDAIDSKIKKDYLKSFEDNGFNLSVQDQEKLNALKEELSKESIKYGNNILNSKKEWSYVLTDDIKSQLSDVDLKEFKEENGVLTLKYNANAMHDLIVKSKSSDFRKIIYDAMKYPASKKSNFDNTEVAKRILQLKQAIANILGYKNYTEATLEDRMANSYEKVTGFLKNIEEKIKPLAKKESKELDAFIEKEFDIKTANKWDRSFYSNIKYEQDLNYIRDAERPYFPTARVFDAVFNLVQDIFGFTFVKDTETFKLPYEDSECYKVYENGVLRSYLLVDLYENPLKSGGAWVSRLVGVTNDTVGVVSLCCNFNKKDVGLNVGEVNTFLHEMGHAVHNFSAKVKYSDMSGTAGMARDAVEIPSQMLEQFAYDKEFLKEVSSHVENGEKIPEDILNSIDQMKNYSIGSHYARQLVFALFDINIHHDFAGDIFEYYQELANKILANPVDQDTNFVNTFSHIFDGGYSAGYYGYMWADIYSIDAYQYVREDVKTNALKFKTEFLEKGSSIEPENLYRNFRGQEVSVKNFLDYYNIN